MNYSLNDFVREEVSSAEMILIAMIHFALAFLGALILGLFGPFTAFLGFLGGFLFTYFISYAVIHNEYIKLKKKKHRSYLKTEALTSFLAMDSTTKGTPAITLTYSQKEVGFHRYHLFYKKTTLINVLYDQMANDFHYSYVDESWYLYEDQFLTYLSSLENKIIQQHNNSKNTSEPDVVSAEVQLTKERLQVIESNYSLHESEVELLRTILTNELSDVLCVYLALNADYREKNKETALATIRFIQERAETLVREKEREKETALLLLHEAFKLKYR